MKSNSSIVANQRQQLGPLVHEYVGSTEGKHGQNESQIYDRLDIDENALTHRPQPVVPFLLRCKLVLVLGQYNSKSEARCIFMQIHSSLTAYGTKHRCTGQCSLQLVKCILLFNAPMKLNILSHQFVLRSCYNAEFTDETTIVGC